MRWSRGVCGVECEKSWGWDPWGISICKTTFKKGKTLTAGDLKD